MYKIRIILRLLILAAVSLILPESCEDVISVKLKDAASRIVIEGRISNNSDSVKVLLSRSTDYFNPTEILSVTDADVRLTDSYGIAHMLPENPKGLYSITGIPVVAGGLYTLNVSADGTNYTGSTLMPAVVELDSLTVEKRPERPKENRLNIHFKDPEGIANYYQLKIYRNGLLLNSFNRFTLYSDKFSDGKFIILTINARRFDIPRFEVNDEIKVQLISIDKIMYDYYQILSDITDGDNFLSAATPANPPNNLNNGALGYFTAISVSEKTMVVK